LDDVGYGASSAFGGLVQTPTLDSLANNGLRYTNFHVTGYCAPTRAALLTGRNHHSAHMGHFPETAVDFPGYDARIPFEKATVAEVLRENGYNTFALGKWHLTPPAEATQAGPFNRWPTGRGFDHYFGFLFAEDDQFHPQLWENNSKVEPDTKGKHLNTLLADKAIHYIADQKSASPDKPFFLYYATGATHEPFQVEEKWYKKYKGAFDKGWDNYREQVLLRQKKLGVIPQDAVLPPRNPGVKAWESLSDDEKKAYSRFMEVYAGFLTQTDYEIGRVVDYLKKINQLDNTAIFVVIGDNGASGEGNEAGYVNGWGANQWEDSSKDSLVHKNKIKSFLNDYDKIGTEFKRPIYQSAWAMAANTPFRYWKGWANTEGGTHDPLIVFYPKGIKEKGGIRNQYSHVIDLLPTTVELTHAVIPEVINGYKQEPVEGVSLAVSFNNAKEVSKHTVQYYETSGKRAIYKDGWKAGTGHIDGTDFKNDQWELYNLNNDFNERTDLAGKYPEKLKELQQVFESEAKKYNIYPLKDWSSHDWYEGRSIFGDARKITLLPEVSQLFGLSGPQFHYTSFSINADVDIPSATTEGVLFATGGMFDGLSLFIQHSKLVVALNTSGHIVHLESNTTVPNGHNNLRFNLNYIPANKDYDPAGTISIYINNTKVGETGIVKAQAYIKSYDDGIDVGRDLNTPVSDRYRIPYEFTGLINNVNIEYPEKSEKK
jgi:arylsulfatase